MELKSIARKETMHHGGDIYRNKIIADFSVNLNPAGTPGEVAEAAHNSLLRIKEYPDIEQEAVKTAVAEWEGVDREWIAAGNGASELIMAAVRAVRPGRALLFEPAYSGYEYALRAAGCGIRRVFQKEENGFALTEEELLELDEETDLLFVCDPANPSGLNLDPGILAALLDRAADLGIRVLLDRSFYLMSDRAEGEDRGHDRMLQQYDNLYILSSLTKLFASPGIRMGYILSRKENIEEIQKQLPEWNLSVTAEEAVKAGCRALIGTAFAEETRELIRRERAFLAELLAEKGLKVFESQSAFLLFKGPDDLYVRLLQRGILIRDCSSFPGLGRGYYRIAVKNHADNLLFKQALEEVL